MSNRNVKRKLPMSFRNAGENLLARFGYRLARLPSSLSGAVYAPLHPVANYSPWNLDEEFLMAYALVRGHSMVDLYRCWELWELTRQSAKLQGDILEVGVWRGGTGALLAMRAQLSGLECSVLLCDTFSGVVKAGTNDTFYSGGEHSAPITDVESLVATLGLQNVRIFPGSFPDCTGDPIGAASSHFRLCHIDVDTYQSARDATNWLWPRMVPGGIIVYDDYGFRGCDGVTKAVNDYLEAPDRVTLYNLNGHAVVIKITPA